MGYIGIDLGTSNSVVAYRRAGGCRFLTVARETLIPSAIFFKEMAESSWIYGKSALNYGAGNPDAVCRHFKRYIGTREALVFHAEAKDAACTYVLGADILLENPQIIAELEAGSRIIIPKSVFEELSRQEEAAAMVLQFIDEHRDRVQLEDLHLDLLPAEGDSNASGIISVALFYDSPETILLSNDRRIAEKVAGLRWAPKFRVRNYAEFSFYHAPERFDAAENEIYLTGGEAASIFLRYLRSEAEKKLGSVSKAVITVPQKFSPIQRNEIKQAALFAGFAEVELYSEPVAAAVAYGAERKENATLLVYDFGGGTLDITISKIVDGEFHVVASDGNAKLGGEILSGGRELDMIDEKNSGLTHEEFAKNKLQIEEACEEIKQSLSHAMAATRIIQLYVESGKPCESVKYRLERERFIEITAELSAKALKALNRVLMYAKLSRKDIDTIILAGGTSRIPAIKEGVEKYFGKPSYADRNPATLIAEGAALLAERKWNGGATLDNEFKVFEKTVSDLGVSLRDLRFNTIIPIDSALPIERAKRYSLVEDYQRELNIECYTREPGSTASRIFNEGIAYIGKIHISDLPPAKVEEIVVTVIFRLTMEYELEIEVRLYDSDGAEIKQGAEKIDIIGV